MTLEERLELEQMQREYYAMKEMDRRAVRRTGGSMSIPKTIYMMEADAMIPSLVAIVRAAQVQGVKQTEMITGFGDRGARMGTEKKYMNLATGSVYTHDGWWYEDEDGVEVNAADRGEVVEIESTHCTIAIKSTGKLAAREKTE